MQKKYFLPIFIVCFICISLGAGFSFMIYQLASAQEESVHQQQRLVLNNIRAPIQNALQSARLASEVLASSYIAKHTLSATLSTDKAQAQKDIQRTLALFPLVEYLAIVDTNHDIHLSSYPMLTTLDCNICEYITQALKGRRILSQPFISPITHSMVIATASPITFDDSIHGVAVAFIDIQKLANATTNQYNMGTTGYTVLVNEDNEYILNPNRSLIGKKIANNDWLSIIDSNTEGSFETDLDGIKKWVIFTTVPQTRWKLLVITPHEEHMISVMKLKNTTLLMGGAMMLFIVLGVGWLMRLLIQGMEKARIAAEEAALTKSSFLANMSHEIRTPLNGIIGIANLLQYTPLSEKQQEYLKKLTFSSTSLLRLLNDILDLSKLDANEVKIECMNFKTEELVTFIKSTLENTAKEKGLEFSIITTDAVPKSLYSDSFRISQVLLNIASNAIKFTTRGSVQVCIDVNQGAYPPPQVLLSVTVRDTGIGISPNELPNLFKPFAQADASTTRRFGGTGLGLMISKNLVELMGGTISVSSQTAVGTTFTFTILCRYPQQAGSPLPAPAPKPIACIMGSLVDSYPLPSASPCPTQEHSPAAHVQQTIQARDAGLPSPALSILLVEDNEINQMIAQECLEHLGAKVVLANNGEEAIHYAQDSRFHLIFMDIQMPVMDGITATQRIRTFDSHTPIIAMTAHAFDSDREKSLNAGMNEHITKPFSMDSLREIIRTFGPQASEHPQDA